MRVLYPFRNSFAAMALIAGVLSASASVFAAPSTDLPIVKLRSLDKTSARTSVFEAAVGSTVKFGDVFIKVQACRKAPEMEQPEAAAFLQVWDVDAQDQPHWIFSGWMFASSPGLSAMDHPVYDVWVLDCLEEKGQETEAQATQPATESSDALQDGEGEIPPEAAQPVPPAGEEPVAYD